MCNFRPAYTRPVLCIRSAQQGTHPCQVFGGVDARARRSGGDVYGDAVAVPERAQLLQGLDRLDGCLRQGGKLAQKTDAVAVDANVA